MSDFIRLVPAEPLPALTPDDAIAGASAAFVKAKCAQAELVANLYLSVMLQAPTKVSHGRLRGMRNEARKQVENAQAVLAAIEESIESLERAG